MLNTQLTISPGMIDIYKSFCASKTGRELLSIAGFGLKELDIGSTSNEYFNGDWSKHTIDPNANASNSGPVHYGLEVTKAPMKLVGLDLLCQGATKRYDRRTAFELISSIIRGDVYFHDASGINVQLAYCYAYSTLWPLVRGIPWGQLHSLPPKRARSFIAQITEMTMDLSQEFAGAIAPADMIVHYTHFIKDVEDEEVQEEITNDFQSFVHVMNKQFRPGGQSPFTNVSIFDRPALKKLFENTIYPDGTGIDLDKVMKVQEIFLRWFCKGVPQTGLPYRFPIVTVNLTTEDKGDGPRILDQEFLEMISKYNVTTGCLNIHSGPVSKVASCCRLISDPERMRGFRADTFGNGGLNIGSHRVVTVNLPRLGYKAAENMERLFHYLDEVLEVTVKLLLVHRYEILAKRLEGGFINSYNAKMISLDHFFSTIGFVGLNELIESMGYNMADREGQELAARVLSHMDEVARQASIYHGVPFNLEEIPAEGAAVKLCDIDKILYASRTKVDLYSNQFFSLHDPVPVSARVRVTGTLMEHVSGGAMLHLNVAEQILNPDIMSDLIRYVVSSRVNHFAVNYGFTICENNHAVIALPDKCPICGSTKLDRMTRVAGYFVPTSKWGTTRKDKDFNKRIWNDISGETAR